MKKTHRDLAGVLAIVLCCASGSPGQTTERLGAAEVDWMKIVPGDAGFYVELHDLAAIREQFKEIGIWDTVLELSAQDAASPTTQPWQRRSEELLGLSPEAAINLLLGRRAALIAASSGQWQNGVLLGEIARMSDLGPLLRGWRAIALSGEGPVRRYRLRGGILLATLGRTLVLGPAGDSDGLWGRTVLLLSGRRGPTMAGRSEFAGLRSRLSREYPSVVYAVWPEGDPSALRGCDRLLIGLSLDSDSIVCELRGNRQAGEPAVACMGASAIGAMPVGSIAVWTQGVDFAALADGLRHGWDERRDSLLQFIFRGFVGSQEGSEGLLAQLGPAYTVVVGVDRPASAAGFAMPAVTLIADARETEDHIERLDRVLGILAQLVDMMAQPGDRQREPITVERRRCEDVELHHVEIGPALARRTGLGFLAGVQPCWTVLDGRLVVSTSIGHVEDIVKAARGTAPRLDGATYVKGLLPRVEGGEVVSEWFFLRGSAVSAIWSSWLSFLRSDHPESLQKEWWQAWVAERVERRGRLGIGLVNHRSRDRQAVVKEVSRGSPAAGIVRVGDVVVGASGRPLTTTQPAREVAARYSARRDARMFEVQVLRNGRPMALKIPVLPVSDFDGGMFDPVQALRRLITLSRQAETVTVWRYATTPDRFDARIEIRWARSG